MKYRVIAYTMAGDLPKYYDHLTEALKYIRLCAENNVNAKLECL